MESSYTLTHTELVDVFRKWNNDVLEHPERYKTEYKPEEGATEQAAEFSRLLNIIKMEKKHNPPVFPPRS